MLVSLYDMVLSLYDVWMVFSAFLPNKNKHDNPRRLEIRVAILVNHALKGNVIK
jgi:hypothetical protein